MNTGVDLSRRATPAGVAVAMALWLAGCASPRPSEFCKALDPEAVMPQHRAEVAKGEDLVYAKHRLAQSVLAYATASNNVYGRDGAELALPEGWQAFCEKPGADRRCEVTSKGRGFQARVYVRTPSEGAPPSEVVLAYRGTTSLNDWLFGNFLKGQYERANNFVLETLTALDKHYPGLVARIEAGQVPLIATGHSLGGGLAEHTAYCFTGLKVRAYSFNTSPRNFKRTCQPHERHGADYDAGMKRFAAQPAEAMLDEIQRERIHRIHQSMEGLSPLRYLVSDKDYDDTRYHFLHGGFISRHSMTAMTMGLTKVASCSMEFDPARPSQPADTAARTRYLATCPETAPPSPCFDPQALRTALDKALYRRRGPAPGADH
jgi:hypothetical protein